MHHCVGPIPAAPDGAESPTFGDRAAEAPGAPEAHADGAGASAGFGPLTNSAAPVHPSTTVPAMIHRALRQLRLPMPLIRQLLPKFAHARFEKQE